ncbi:MAG: threonine synthase [Fimbriimonadaceae bacterium]|nr:threonine synthase [Fimbriimonadaceae bacterium]
MNHLECSLTGERFPADRAWNLSPAGRPLLARYDLRPDTMPRVRIRDREPNLWRYREVLPPCEPLTLGEGLTPLHWTPRLGPRWYVKDEGVNPSASFKARGMAVAVAVARHLGLRKLAAPSAGNAAGALAAYAAKAGLEAFVFMPADTPRAFVVECRNHGARVELVDGLITDCGAIVAARKEAEGWFDVSTLKEPYRLEGKKTMAYELVEDLGRVPDAIVYPTGGGTGLIGMWKAFAEMEALGWIGPERPKMISVQAEGCAPMARAFGRGERFAKEFPNARTVASGLRVPKAVGDFLILDAVRSSEGTARTVTDDAMIAAAKEMSRLTGVFACPEGGATLACARDLAEEGFLKPDDLVVLFNTGSGVKYLEALA